MTLLADMVTELYQRALSSMREESNILGTGVGPGAGVIALASGQSLGSVQQGTILQVDWELYYVTAAVGPGEILVQPGWFGSVTAAHSAGAVITVNPRFPAVDIVRAINQDIDDLSAPTNGLFNALEVTLIYNPVWVGYDLTDVVTGQAVPSTQIMDVLAVRAQEFGPERRWPMLPLRTVKLERNANRAVFPSGVSLKMYRPAYPGQQVRVSYKAPYSTPLVNPSDDVEAVTGLHPQAHDIPVLGAMCRMMEVREFKRTFVEDQPQPRTATEVPVGASLEAMKQVLAHRADRIAAERQRLERSWAVQNR